MIPNVGRRRQQRWSLRLLAIGLGLLPLLLCEVVLHLTGWPPYPPPIDPLVDLHHLRPLFTLSADRQRYSIGPERLELFRPVEFAAHKPDDLFRIFALGGSTTQGEPYSTPTAFPEWMRIDLEAATSGRPIEVINCGGLSYASYRVKAILQEVLTYGPDLIVIYSGQNEFLEERSYAGWRDVPLPLARADGWLQQWKVAQFARWLTQGVSPREGPVQPSATELKREVDALLDYEGGLQAYHRNDPWREPVVQHFRWNLARMVEQCQRAHVPVVVMRPVVNLLDCPPIKYEAQTDLSEANRQRFDRAWKDAQAEAGGPAAAYENLQIAYAIDPEHAGVNFFLGRLAWEGERWDEAAQYLRAAKEYDVCPLRALTAIQDAVSQIAHQYQIPMIDADQLFSDRSPQGMVGNQWLVDHVHPTIEGHQLLGEALCELVLREKWLPESHPAWRDTRQARLRAHLTSLGEEYFHRGKQRLEGLLLWTQGRAKKIRP